MNTKINVDTQNMPPQLSVQHFDHWIYRFARLGQNFDFDDISALVPTLTVSFSAKRKKKTYGFFSVPEAKERIRDLFPPKAELREWLEDRLASIVTRQDLWNNMEDLAYSPNDLFPYDGSEILERIREIASAVQFPQWVLGKYFPDRREIVLYTNNILCTREKKTVEQAFEEVFAHELFHAYHYFYLHNQNNEVKDADILSRTDQTRKVVLESLAAYYENAYCEEYNIPTDLWNVWCDNRPAIYPYAGAKYIQNKREFKEILEISSDLDAALRKLLFKGKEGTRQFYMVKNGAISEENVGIRPTKTPSDADMYNTAAVRVHCMEQLHATCSRWSSCYFNTEKMREYFKRHGEEIGSKMRIVCQAEGKRINIYLEGNAKQGVSPALDLLRADSGIKALCNSDRSGKKFTCIISRVKVIGLDELKDAAGDPLPFSAVAPTIDANLQQFQTKLTMLESILDRL